MKLDQKGRCCGRKPIMYKREPHYFCTRCDRAYSLETGEQIQNWAWVRTSPYAEFQRNPRYSPEPAMTTPDRASERQK